MKQLRLQTFNTTSLYKDDTSPLGLTVTFSKARNDISIPGSLYVAFTKVFGFFYVLF